MTKPENVPWIDGEGRLSTLSQLDTEHLESIKKIYKKHIEELEEEKEIARVFKNEPSFSDVFLDHWKKEYKRRLKKLNNWIEVVDSAIASKKDSPLKNKDVSKPVSINNIKKYSKRNGENGNKEIKNA